MSDASIKIPRNMEEFWDVAIIEGEPVRLIATEESQLTAMRRLIDERPESVAELVRNAKRDEEDGGVTLWLDPGTLERITKVPEDLL